MTNQQIAKTGALLIAGVLAVFVINVVFENYEVIQKGELLEYTSGGTIYQVRLFDKFDFYAEPEVRPSDDVLVSVVLFGIAFIALTFAFLEYHRRRQSENKVFPFFVVLFAGAIYLASDELFGIHESLGHNMQFLMRIPGIHRPDDVIVASYGFFALAFIVYFRNVLLKARGTLRYFVAAFVLFLLAAASDIVAIGKIEEILEVLCVFVILYGTLAIGRSVFLDDEG